ncbi:MAG: thioredoxin family protein [Proteobacteria bacterium]|nr:thioredoxin family protein [Pseudomonadota bacterium]
MKLPLASTLLASLVLAASGALAGEIQPYDAATFASLQAAGRPVVIDVYAAWCPTCRAQAPLVSALMKKPAFRDFTVLRVDFDTQTDLRRELGVPRQSTLIVFRGKREVARSVGDTDLESIERTLGEAA